VGDEFPQKKVCVGVLLKKEALDMPQKELLGSLKNLKLKKKKILKKNNVCLCLVLILVSTILPSTNYILEWLMVNLN
jgi:hypothetical protein